MMATYYHVSPIDHPIGTVLSPGRAGEQYRRFIKGGNQAPQNINEAYALTWESVLETARRLIDSSLPSRMSCVYASTSKTAAAAFRDQFRPGAHIFEIDVAEDTPSFRGDLDGITNTKNGDTFLD